MRHWVVVLFALALAGCKREPNFDERFDAAQARISKAAEAIDSEISASEAAMPDPSEAALPM